MITNQAITYYKKGLDSNKLTIWTKYIFDKVWLFYTKGTNVNNGYEKSNLVEVRIPLEYVSNTDLFQIGDIIAVGNQENITKQSDLEGKEYFNITSININNFGNTPHVHLGGN